MKLSMNERRRAILAHVKPLPRSPGSTLPLQISGHERDGHFALFVPNDPKAHLPCATKAALMAELSQLVDQL